MDLITILVPCSREACIFMMSNGKPWVHLALDRRAVMQFFLAGDQYHFPAFSQQPGAKIPKFTIFLSNSRVYGDI